MSESPYDIPELMSHAIAAVQASPEKTGEVLADMAAYRAEYPASTPDVQLLERVHIALNGANAAIARLLSEIDRLSALVPNTAAANASRRVAARERANLVRVLAGQGLTNAEIADMVDRSVRHVQRLKNG